MDWRLEGMLQVEVGAEEGDDLVGDGGVAGLGGVTELLIDVVEDDEGEAVVAADDAHGLGELGFEFGIENEVDTRLRVVEAEGGTEAGHGRTEIPHVVFGPVGVFIVAEILAGPGVVGDAAGEDDIGFPEVFDASVEGAGLVVLVLIAEVADGGAGVGIVHLECPAHAGEYLVPPRLLNACDVVALGAVGGGLGPVPGFVGGGREPAFEGGVTVAEDGDA